MLLRLVALTVVLAAPPPAVAQPMYTVVDLGHPGGGSQSFGRGINNLGEVVGTAVSSDLFGISFRTAAGATPASATVVYYPDVQAVGINNSGQVAGSFNTNPSGTPAWHAFRLSGSQVPGDLGTDLGTWSTGGYSDGRAINNSGQVTGSATVPSGQNHAFRTTATGKVSDPGTDLGVWFPGGSSTGFGINASGQVTGMAGRPGGFNHAFRTTATGLVSDPGTDLGTLGGTYSVGYAINDAGQVTGAALTADGRGRAFRTTPTGLISDPGADLGTLGGGYSMGFGINALGEVVGMSGSGGGTHAFVYTNQMWDLNHLIPAGSGWELEYAQAVNDNLWITGWGSLNGDPRGFLLIPASDTPSLRAFLTTPVPEPSTLALAGVAAAVGLIRRRMK